MAKFEPVIKKRNCYNCIHYLVCHMLETVRQANSLSRPPYKTLFFAVPENIGSACQYRKESRTRKTK